MYYDRSRHTLTHTKQALSAYHRLSSIASGESDNKSCSASLGCVVIVILLIVAHRACPAAISNSQAKKDA